MSSPGFLAPAAIALLVASVAHAEWPRDPAENLPIGNAVFNTQRVTAAPDPSGGAFVFWEDLRQPDADLAVVGMRILADGTRAPGWPDDGLLVAASPGDEQEPRALADGAGGVFVTWQTMGDPAGLDLHLLRLTAEGTTAPGWSPGGLVVAAGPGDQRAASLLADGTGGVFVAWQDARFGVEDVYAKRITASGTVSPGWPATGLGVCRAAGRQLAPLLVSDGAGGAIVVWEDHRYGNPDIYACRLNPGGYVEPGWPSNGFPICLEAGEQRRPCAVADGVGGVIAAWEDTRSGDSDIYVGHLAGNASFPSGWNGSGRAVRIAAGSQLHPVIVSNVTGGWLAVWEDLTGGSTGIFALALNASGAPPVDFPTSGFRISNYGRVATELSVAPGPEAAPLVVWNESSDGFTQEVVSAIPDGTLGYGSYGSGIVLSAASGDQLRPCVVSDGEGGLLAFWLDARAPQSRVYGQKLDATGSLGDNEPRIVAVTDVPADQGGVVRVAWDASPLDPGRVVSYFVYREVPGPTAPASLPHPAAITVPGYWEPVGSVAAAGHEGYSLVVPTTGDSGAVGNPLTRFLVVARSDFYNGWVLPAWESNVMSGYSVDNLAPGAPTALAGERVAAGIRLSWEPAVEPDVDRYRVHRLNSDTQVPGPETQVAELSEPGWTDPAGPGWYAVVAVDRAGNESPAALLSPSGTLAVPGAGMRSTWLASPAPNPARDAITLRLGLAAEGPARLDLYDLAGRRVASLVNATLPAGEHRLTWDLSGHGGPLPDGLYLLRLTSGGVTKTRRLHLLR